MRLLLPRCWLQFRLTTWFILVAILAWAMIDWPWVVRHLEWQAVPVRDRSPMGYFIAIDNRLNPDLLYPALALAAFVGWKGFWFARELKRSTH